MSEASRAMTILPVSECWELLANESLGRLVTCVDGDPHIFPVNFVVRHRTVLFRTAEGTKLISAAINNNVLFEVDGYDGAAGWSVIVAGQARVPRTDEDIADADQAELRSWAAPEQSHYVRILPRSVTGRRFVFGT
ncbi:pyridoxamine 5'-phosphate oxidase family protein [Mycolicibacterium vaccae]|uniref:pyridoxamine 5'-phosphate oxidase family protein n=1 Tax=Mycolicibacterium vaccae TaxID=1810 RepID=UPI003CF53D95